MAAGRAAWGQRLGVGGHRWIAVCMALSLVACGYHVLHAGAPFDRRHVVLMPFAEAEPNGMSAPMAAALSRRLTAGGVHLQRDVQGADAQLTGTIHVANAPSAALRGVQVYAVVAHVHAELQDTAGHVVWQRDLQLKEEFLPSDPARDVQPLVSEARRQAALLRLAEQAAAGVHDALVLDSHLAALRGAEADSP